MVVTNKSLKDQLAEVYQLTPKRVNEEKHLKSVERFLGKCRVCGEPLHYCGGNILACNNPKCKGYAKTVTDKVTGEKRTEYRPVYRLLDDKGVRIAKRLFD